jgi:hypothetical protein
MGDAEEPKDRDLALSLVRDDPPFRVMRRLGLIPAKGLGTGRRAVFFALIAWLPVAAWALLTRHALSTAVGEPLFEHFGVHVRCLIAIPLLILAQGLAHRTTRQLLPWFVRSGVIPESRENQLRAVVESIRRLRGAVRPWIVIAALVIAWTAVGSFASRSDELNWAVEGSATDAHLGFGGWWFLLVARPIYIALVLSWLWQLVLLTLLFRRIAAVGLELVPTHPDRLGGLAFVERFEMMFSPVVLALSAVMAAHLAHEVVYHDLPIASLKGPALAFIVLVLLVFLAPLLVFTGPLAGAKRRALFRYGALVGRHGALVRKRWILGEEIGDEEILQAPELGPVADTVSLYQAVRQMRPFAIGKPALMAIALPAIFPLLLVAMIKVPIRQVLGKLLKALT